MKIVINWIETNWKDPVWSKVFAAGIISLITTVSLIIWSLIKQVPVFKVIDYFKKTNIEINLFTLIIIGLIFLAVIIPMLYFDIISFQLRNRRIPDTIKYREGKIEKILNGSWILDYCKITDLQQKIFTDRQIKDRNRC